MACPGEVSALTPPLPGSSTGLRPASWLGVPEASALCPCLPASVSVQPRERAPQALRALRGIWGVTPQPRRLAPGLPPRKATTSGRPSRARPRPPSGALAAPEGPRKAASADAGASPGGGGCRLLPRRPQPPVECRAWGGRHVLTQHPHRARVLRSGPSCPLAVWTMSAGPAASGTTAPSILKCSPHGTLERTGCHGSSRERAGSPQKPQGQPPLLGSHPSTRAQPGDLAGRPGGSGCRSLEPLCSCCPEGLLGNLQRPPQGLFSAALVLLKRDTQSRDGAGITGAVTPVNQGVTAPSC